MLANISAPVLGSLVAGVTLWSETLDLATVAPSVGWFVIALGERGMIGGNYAGGVICQVYRCRMTQQMYISQRLDLHVCKYLFHRSLHTVLEILEKYRIVCGSISISCTQNGVDQCRHVFECLRELGDLGIGGIVWLKILPLW